MHMSVTDTDTSYHAQNQFRDRIDSDITLIESCWYGGAEIDALNREYKQARVYTGPLVDTDVVLLARSPENPSPRAPDLVIATVLPAHGVEFEYV